jgi:hypothetical protein
LRPWPWLLKQQQNPFLCLAFADDLIDSLMACQGDQEFAQTVAESITELDSKFWLRVASRNDMAASERRHQQHVFFCTHARWLLLHRWGREGAAEGHGRQGNSKLE